MKLTKKLEAEIKQVMDDYWNAYFRGDIDYWAKYLVNDYRNIGGTEEEIWNSKQEILDYTHRVIDQMKGVSEIRNKQVQIIHYDPYIMVHELLDIYIKIEDDWTFYQKFRLSSLIQKQPDGWKVLHQHGSYPDSKAAEGDAFSFDQLKSENIKLQKAVKNRTAELEQKNRELEIETALEKVRAVAMGMKKADDMLIVCKTISQQLTQLGVKEIRNVQTAIFYESRGTYMNYEYYAKHDKTFITEVDFKNHKIQLAFAQKMLKGPNEEVLEHLKGKKLQDWYTYQKSTNQFADKYLLKADSLNYYWYSLGPVALGISTYYPLTKDETNLFKRFLKVFELAYRRYLDIEKATAQAREAQIEVALERVRSRSMGMHSSLEMKDVITVVINQLVRLGFDIDLANFNYLSTPKEWIMWLATPDFTYPELLRLPAIDHPLFNRPIEAAMKGSDFMSDTLTEDEFHSVWKHFYAATSMNEYDSAERKQYIARSTGLARSVVFMKQIALSISNFKGIPYNEEQNNIIKRFANVFEQSYTRFLDLQKAETQAREAKIEAALEKARSRSMGMQSSDELPEVANVLFLEVQALGIPAWSCGYNIITEDKTVATCWMSSEGTLQLPFKLRLFGEASFAEMGDFIRSEQTMLIQELGDKALEEHYAYMKSLPDLKPTFDQLDELGLSLPTYQINHLCKFTQGFLLFITYEKVPASHDVFKRFTKVFEQTYTRFLDLKKAEAQTREAQIELGLERVRARAMAMQKSDELSELVDTVFKELTKLDFALNWCIINIIDESSLSNTVWAANPDIDMAPESYYMKFEDYPYHHAILKDWKERKTKSEYTLEEDEKRIYDEYLFSETEFKRTPEAAQAASRAMKKYVCSFSFSNFGGLQTVGDSPLSDANLDILSRFGKVFDLTYTRFNDLKKAEAQAKESHIQLAMERVRARTMAMHKSDELFDIILVVSEQLQQLNIKFSNVSFGVNNPDYDMRLWMAVNGYSNAYPIQWTFIDNPGITRLKEAQHQTDKVFSDVLTQKENNEWLQHIFNCNPPFDIFSEENKVRLLNTPGYARSMIIMKDIILVIGNYAAIPYTDEENEIFKRFVNVFEQSYTRFLDLQKAEAQAREARIEAALEKVRSRTMAMQKGEELKEVVVLLYKELIALGVNNFVTCGYVEINEKINRQFTWVTSPGGDTFGLFYLPLTGDTTFDERYAAWKQQQIIFHQTVAGEVRSKHLEYAITTFNSKEAEEMVLSQFPDPTVFYCFNFSHGYLHLISGSELKKEEELLLVRFTRVFEQTYARFLDLQKAEAQAREAQIQLALERVRARTMAMQKSEELEQCAVLLFQQIGELGINAWSAGFSIWQENDTYFIGYNTNPTGGIGAPFRIPLTEDVFFTTIREAKRRGEEFLVFESEGESLVETYHYMDTLPVVGDVMRGIVSAGYELPKYQVTHCGFFPEGHLMFITLEPHPEAWDIFKRFTRVFEQTYTRFLDLQKAEAQAREAKIEAALERTRTQSMIMQHSNELDDTLRVFHQQVLLLGIPSAFSFLWLPDEEKDQHKFWAAWAINNSTDFSSKAINYPLDRNEPATAQCLIDWKSNEPVYSYHVPPAAVENYFAAWQELFDGVEQLKPEHFSGGLHYVEAFMKYGCFGVMVATDLTEDEKKLLNRFAIEFERTYTRFLDLQKAEAQAREAQIEAALERVRSQSMGMQSSKDLSNVTSAMFEQLRMLGGELYATGIVFCDKYKHHVEQWHSVPAAGMLSPFIVPVDLDYIHQYRYDQWKNDTELFSVIIPEDFIAQHFETMFNLPTVKAVLDDFAAKNIAMPDTPSWEIDYGASFRHGYILVSALQPFANADILPRFAKVFEQTYTRFLDLQKAEAQTREAKINLAVERVRARALAMFKSEEILELVFKLKQEMMDLEIPNVVAATIHLKEKEGNYTMWDLTALDYSEGKFHQPMVVHYRLEEVDPNLFIKRMWENTDPYFLVVQDEEDFKRTIQFLRDHGRTKEADESEDFIKTAGIKYGYHPTIPLNNGRMCIDLLEPPSDEIEMILTKMGAAFDLAYKRFEDLTNSEAQLREAQIEASLERVRSRTMAMHKSDELLEASEILFVEMQKLGIESLTAGYVLIDKEEKNGLNYTPDPLTKKILPLPVIIPHNETVAMQQVVENWKKGNPFFIIEMNEEETINHQTFIAERSTNFSLNAAQLIAISPAKLFLHNFYFKEGYVLIVGGEKLSAEQTGIMLRFTKVFQQTYTRFNDLQKAEAQAREATIEAALEKIRSRSLAMHKSDELNEVLTILFQKLKELQIPVTAASIGLYIDGSKDMNVYVCGENVDGLVISNYRLPHFNNKISNDFDNAREKKFEFLSHTYTKEEKNAFYEYLFEHTSIMQVPDDIRRMIFESPAYTISMAPVNHSIFAVNDFEGKVLAENEVDIIKRFAKVFDQTYTRFLDLQKSEFQTHQAKIETALEKVRARALAMQQPEELAEVAQVMRYEMGLLGVEELETSSIYIHEEASENAECWYAIKDSKVPEKQLVSDHFKLQLNDTWVGQQMHAFYHSNKKQTSIPMQGANRKEWINYCSKQSKLLDGFYGDVIPDRTYHLYKFSNGTIGAATPGNISAESWDLLQRAASVFSLAYSRFKDLTQARIDLQKLKEEKQRAEDALTELQATQKQLIQSEKMASLGELTAGIAHEIQNPLNFVNNFSEVSNELIDEMKTEFKKGDTTEGFAIADDIKQNLEKINHHGKRAADIVKGMLQHSSRGNGVKQPTDINALCDEYLRLSYHGIRAKDKNFNATMKTDFDESIGNINIIPQDIGRVILNLINNAFYAAPLPPQGGFSDPDYKHNPTVWISTKKVGDKVFVSVRDNGPGIPQKILDKIFQPFFTTKPTGQGTGLGLSLSYDIVKAHGGELSVRTPSENVQTTEARPDDPVGRGVGAEFIITLPFKTIE